MTLAEFMHPFRTASRKLQLAAVLYYWERHEKRAAGTTSEIRDALRRARMPAAKSANLSRDLAHSVPYVDRGAKRGTWLITGTGKTEVRNAIGATDVGQADVADLTALAQAVADASTRGYIEEAVKCLGAGARRAAVVFLWTGAVAVMRDALWEHGPKNVEAALRRHSPKSKLKDRGDFEAIKDSDLIQAAQDLGVVDKSEKRRLREGLELRNDCGHPARYRPGEKKVSSFIEDLLSIVFSKA